MKKTKPKKIRQRLIGKVVKIIDAKTAKVEVERILTHRIYGKRYKHHKKYLVQTDKKVEIDQKVMIESIPPVSKNKKFKITAKS